MSSPLRVCHRPAQQRCSPLHGRSRGYGCSDGGGKRGSADACDRDCQPRRRRRHDRADQSDGRLGRRHRRIQVKIKGEQVEKEMYEKGLKIRREVLGSEYVDKAISTADDFNRPLQELVTTYCWGECWGRPGLDRKTRSMLNLAMISALNRPHEVKAHVKGAINNGLTKNDIQEVFLQVAIYVGVPAAVDSFRLAREVFQEMGI